MATRLFKRRPEATPAGKNRSAIIDIGSNSIRLVVYEGPRRLPAPLFNEKVLAGLGKSLAKNGSIDPEALAVARTALARFALLAREMEVSELRTVATAAVRDASNGHELIETARLLGLEVELLSGEDEAVGAGLGVLSAIPDADGIVGDLGGGSLELVRVKGGEVLDRASFPLGVLRIPTLRGADKATFERRVAKLIRESGWSGRGKGLPLYMVGGSWRALARLEMHLSGYPLPVIHAYPMDPAAVSRIARSVGRMSRGRLKAVPNLSGGRIPTLVDASALLSILLRQLGCSTTIASAYGLREGLLYERLSAEERALDPLIEAARDEGARLGRFTEHGDLIARWIAPLFDDPPEDERLRHAACLLADVGWQANPEFRDERGREIALHGNWVAIDARGRAMVAQALHTALGGGMDAPEPLTALADWGELARAAQWGLAIRLGQRLSGGVAGPLRRSSVAVVGEGLALTLEPRDAALYGEAVAKRHKVLASAMGLRPERA
jgi:exopolyphosphatase / guanosine-5'-triphosphate,3'-diphosphate pyrophosphatase